MLPPAAATISKLLQAADTDSMLHQPCSALLVMQAPPVAAGSSKVACDYSNRLCQWNASYAFGGAVLGDLVRRQGLAGKRADLEGRVERGQRECDRDGTRVMRIVFKHMLGQVCCCLWAALFGGQNIWRRPSLKLPCTQLTT
jgi:hypothetical protein